MITLKNITPAQLKKYGIYAILSLSLSLNVYLIMDNRKQGREDVWYERKERERLQEILLEQNVLKTQQENLLKNTELNIDSLTNTNSE